jgi:two-component system OmpR family sensor kinase
VAERRGLRIGDWTALLLVCALLTSGILVWLLAPSTWLSASAPLGAVIGGAGVLVLCAYTALAIAGRRAATRLDRARAAEREAEREAAAQARRRFLSRLDHELKNPVTVVRSLVAERAERDPAWAGVRGQADRMARLVGDLRALAELEETPLAVEPVDPGLLIREAVEDLAEETGTGPSARISVQLPSAPWPLLLCPGDPDLLRLAIGNLVSNAVKYTDVGQRVEVRGSEADGWVVIEVADTGRGIPAAEVATVFEELGRASNALDRPGSGVGLALVRVIVARHGGTVSLRSRLGEGTSVRLALPLPTGH